MVPRRKTELGYTNIGTSYRYWKVAGDNAGATRATLLLTARNSGQPGDGRGWLCRGRGTIELPPIGD